MNLTTGRVTWATTGTKTLNCSFAPVEVELRLVPTGASGPYTGNVRLSLGRYDIANAVQTCDTATWDATRQYQNRYTDRLASIFAWNGSAWTEVFRADYNSLSGNDVIINVVTTPGAVYQVEYVIRG